MKKKLVYFLILLLVTVVIIYLFRYKQALDFDHKVPTTATSVVHVNLRQIEHHVLIDFFENPFSYIGFESRKKEDKISFLDEVVIPKNVLFFTSDSLYQNNWISSRLKIKGKAKLPEYLLSQKFEKNTRDTIDFYSKNRLVLAVHKKELTIAFKKNAGSNIEALLLSTFKENQFFTDKSDFLQPLLKSKADVTFIDRSKAFAELNFKEGLLEFKGTLSADFDLFLTHDNSKITYTSLVLLSGRVNKKSSFFNAILSEENVSKFNNLTKLSLDSVFHKWNGKLNLNLQSIESRVDTIVTYEYDDDFNKVAVQSTQDVVIPDVNLEIETEVHRNLFSYLTDNNAIQIVENDTLFTLFPLYKLHAHNVQGNLNISADESANLKNTEKKTSKLHAYFNIEKYLLNQLDFFTLPSNDYTNLFEDAALILSDKNKLSLRVQLKNKKRNFMGQFVKP